ncbi:MAG: lipopolysaccharide transport periplasmic protein LptA [Aquabacterium sp.]|nr:lipopolysaccharide transport periplasmic protein LptA [Aquabacterium sp.]
MYTLNPPPLLFVLLVTACAAAWAEKADRSRPMTLESDQPCTVSLLKQTSVCSGNVVISQGTLLLRADKLELRETPEGYQMAVVIGSAGKPATYRQKRDGADETVEGQAQRIDYDSRAGTLRFEGAAVVRRLRGSTVADEIQGQQIIWDSTAESFNVRGGAVTAGNPGGRVRAVISPRVPASEPAPAAVPAGGDLKASPGLGDRR